MTVTVPEVAVEEFEFEVTVADGEFLAKGHSPRWGYPAGMVSVERDGAMLWASIGRTGAMAVTGPAPTDPDLFVALGRVCESPQFRAVFAASVDSDG